MNSWSPSHSTTCPRLWCATPHGVSAPRRETVYYLSMILGMRRTVLIAGLGALATACSSTSTSATPTTAAPVIPSGAACSMGVDLNAKFVATGGTLLNPATADICTLLGKTTHGNMGVTLTELPPGTTTADVLNAAYQTVSIGSGANAKSEPGTDDLIIYVTDPGQLGANGTRFPPQTIEFLPSTVVDGVPTGYYNLSVEAEVNDDMSPSDATVDQTHEVALKIVHLIMQAER